VHGAGGILDEHQTVSTDHGVELPILGHDRTLVKYGGADARVAVRAAHSHSEDLGGPIRQHN
jgi:hypothetical protein